MATSHKRGRDTDMALILRKFGFNPAIFLKHQEHDSEIGLGVGFSKITYDRVASSVGLQSWLQFRDAKTFDVHRSRIPTSMFKSIIEDIDTMLIQYGPPPGHRTEQAMSRFFSPITNNLVKNFAFAIRNEPETIAAGRIEHFFKSFGAITILFIEIKHLARNEAERVKGIARVIAECDGCDLNNRKMGYDLPVHCIFTNGWSFEFFKFVRNPNPSFYRGCYHGDPEHLQKGLQVPDFTTSVSSLPFILQLRRICETIFDVMLNAYIAGLEACYILSEKRGKNEDNNRSNFDGWNKALQQAEYALAKFREVEDKRKDGNFDSADAIVQEALLALQQSTGAMPTPYRTSPIMKDWDDMKVRQE